MRLTPGGALRISRYLTSCGSQFEVANCCSFKPTASAPCSLLQPALIFNTTVDWLSMSLTGPGNLTLKMRRTQPGKIDDLQPRDLPKSSYPVPRKRGSMSVDTCTPWPLSSSRAVPQGTCKPPNHVKQMHCTCRAEAAGRRWGRRTALHPAITA